MDFGVTLFLLISRETLNALVWNMATLRLERFEVTIITSSVSESGASLVMEVLLESLANED